MKLLLTADTESPYYWDHYVPGRLDGIDLILSAGDLKAEYLSFLVTMGRAPVVYVHGNHDRLYERQPPEGCDCAEDTLLTVKGLRILGLGGSVLYSGGPHQYTERQMEKRIRKLRWKLRRAGGVDVVLTHAPPAGYGDMEDPAHRGFACFLGLIDQWQPKLFVHGHVHMNYGPEQPRCVERGNTLIVNAWERYLIDL